MFSSACNLLKMDAYSNDFQEIVLAKNPCYCHQIRSNQRVNVLNHFHFYKLKFLKKTYQSNQTSKMATKDTRQYVAATPQPVETSLQSVTLVSLTQVAVGKSLRRLKLVGFIYVPVRRWKDVSNWSVLLTYQLRRHDVVSAGSETFKSVSKMDQFILGTIQYVSSVSQVVQSLLRYQLVRHYNVSKSLVSFRYQL